MTPISFARGDATCPQGDGQKLVAHVCNDVGAWGAGFVLAISLRWPGPARAFHAQHAGDGFQLGDVQLVRVTPEILVANMIGQHGIRRASGRPPIRYDAVERCLHTVGDQALDLQASVHMPRIGCGLAGGTWERIEPIVARTLCARDVPVTVYDFP